jgi:hypothetical protein
VQSGAVDSPTRLSGCLSRSGSFWKWAMLMPLRQTYPRERGLSLSALTLTIRLPSVCTSSPQLQKQSTHEVFFQSLTALLRRRWTRGR